MATKKTSFEPDLEAAGLTNFARLKRNLQHQRDDANLCLIYLHAVSLVALGTRSATSPVRSD